MATFSSEKVTVNTSSSSLFNFISDLNNLEELMPADKISDWQSSVDTCSFKIHNLGKIGFKHDVLTEPTQLKLISLNDKPFGFTMIFNIDNHGAQSKAQIIVDADLNPMLKMMAEKPLTAFFNGIAQKLQAKPF